MSDAGTTTAETLRQSPRTFYWLFAWCVVSGIWIAGMVRWGVSWGDLEALLWGTVICGYMFFMDISDRVCWTSEQICWRRWDFPLRRVAHTVRISDITRVETALHPANYNPAKPFDRVSFISPADTVVVLPSFHRREELEELLRLVRSERQDAVFDPNITEFVDGGYTDWWPYR